MMNKIVSSGALKTRCFLGCVVLLIAFHGAPAPVSALDLTQSGTQWAPYLEWSLDNSTFSGNAYDLIASATFVHQGSGATHTTEMFYAGGTTWKLRFTGTKLGMWTVSTTSSDADLNGHTGTITINPNQGPNIRGFVTFVGSQWV